MKDILFAISPDKCVVCGAPTETTKDKISRDLHGDIYVFCSPECYKKFEESPESYLNGDEEEIE